MERENRPAPTHPPSVPPHRMRYTHYHAIFVHTRKHYLPSLHLPESKLLDLTDGPRGTLLKGEAFQPLGQLDCVFTFHHIGRLRLMCLSLCSHDYLFTLTNRSFTQEDVGFVDESRPGKFVFQEMGFRKRLWPQMHLTKNVIKYGKA